MCERLFAYTNIVGCFQLSISRVSKANRRSNMRTQGERAMKPTVDKASETDLKQSNNVYNLCQKSPLQSPFSTVVGPTMEWL